MVPSPRTAIGSDDKRPSPFSKGNIARGKGFVAPIAAKGEDESSDRKADQGLHPEGREKLDGAAHGDFALNRDTIPFAERVSNGKEDRSNDVERVSRGGDAMHLIGTP